MLECPEFTTLQARILQPSGGGELEAFPLITLPALPERMDKMRLFDPRPGAPFIN
jgi:hypothetical protein